MENLPPENIDQSVDSDAAIIEAIATIYSNWISNEQKKNKVYISQILNKIQEKICQAETEERKIFVKEQFKIHAETLDLNNRISIYGVFHILNEAIQGEGLKKWTKDFADSFLKTQDKNFLKKKDNYELKKCFRDLMEIVNKEQQELDKNQKQQEVDKNKEKRIAKAQRNKIKRERKKLEKVSQLLSSLPIIIFRRVENLNLKKSKKKRRKAEIHIL